MNKILIANRGEIAVRIIRTARSLGFRTVAVYSDADCDSLHVNAADQAVHIGAASAGESYLLIQNMIAAAEKSGADAIHPGYGFLAENAQFSRACDDAGITFIGPGAAAIELMGSKRLSKVAMLEAGVPCIPGYQGADQDDAVLLAEAQHIGFPLMVKASAGGGGRGMRLVHTADELAEQIKTARSEAHNAFGSDELIVERLVIEPRHIEIQVFADNYGNVVYLGERDCSIQRRHQKVVEEAPSPFVDEVLRRQMGEAAVNAATACDYRGAGTVEFLVDKDKHFYFLEMNTRLQVEHPVTELVTGLDLVAWQLLVAAGQPLPLQQQDIVLQGHAVEVRLYAEDPRQDFMPQTGPVLLWQTPLDELPARPGIRIDPGIQQNQIVSPYYDPLLAKVIAFGEQRELAIRRLASAMQDIRLLGVNTNKHFLHNVLRHPVFIEGRATTAFIAEHFSADPSLVQGMPSLVTIARAALLFYHCGDARKVKGNAAVLSKDNTHLNWAAAVPMTSYFTLEYDGQSVAVQLSANAENYQVTLADDQQHEKIVTLELLSCDNQRCVVVESGIRQSFDYAINGHSLFLDDGSGHYCFQNITHKPAELAGAAGNGELKASMDGVIVDVMVNEGDSVDVGQTLVTLEAMKMEHPIKAGIGGVVELVCVQVGQQVKSKQLLVRIVEPQ